MTIRTPNYTIQGCNEFTIKDDGIYYCSQIWKSDVDEIRDEKLMIPKDIFIEAFNKWCNCNEEIARQIRNEIIDEVVDKIKSCPEYQVHINSWYAELIESMKE